MASFLREILSNNSADWLIGSHLFQRVASFLLIEFLLLLNSQSRKFSSLSESGFIPTNDGMPVRGSIETSSHLFQRVASFLHVS